LKEAVRIGARPAVLRAAEEKRKVITVASFRCESGNGRRVTLVTDHSDKTSLGLKYAPTDFVVIKQPAQ